MKAKDEKKGMKSGDVLGDDGHHWLEKLMAMEDISGETKRYLEKYGEKIVEIGAGDSLKAFYEFLEKCRAISERTKREFEDFKHSLKHSGTSQANHGWDNKERTETLREDLQQLFEEHSRIMHSVKDGADEMLDAWEECLRIRNEAFRRVEQKFFNPLRAAIENYRRLKGLETVSDFLDALLKKAAGLGRLNNPDDADDILGICLSYCDAEKTGSPNKEVMEKMLEEGDLEGLIALARENARLKRGENKSSPD